MVESNNKGMEAESPVVAQEGQKFEEAREAHGLSRAEVAYSLNLTEAYIEHIELEQFAQLPGPTFVRGYVRNYAKMLKISAEGLLDSYEAYLQSQQLPQKPLIRINRQVKASDPLVKWVTAFIVVMVFALSMFWWSMKEDVSESLLATGTASVEASEPVPQEDAAVVKLEGAPIVSETVVDLTENANSLSPVLDSAPIEEPSIQGQERSLAVVEEVVTASLLADAQVEATVSIQLEAEFLGESWMEVKNASGKVLFTGVKKAGATIRLESTDSFDIVIGNAAAVNLSFDGETIDLSRYTNTRNVAVLKLGSP